MRILQIIIIFRQLPEISYAILISLNDSRRCEGGERSQTVASRQLSVASGDPNRRLPYVFNALGKNTRFAGLEML